LVIVDPGSGLSVTIERTSGASFDVINENSVTNSSNSYPASFASQALSPFSDFDVDDVFVATFSSIVEAVTIDAGDFAQDVDALNLSAYSNVAGTGTLLDADVGTFQGNLTNSGDNNPANDPVTLAVSQQGIRSITFVGDGGVDFPNSVFFDNLTVTTAIPEPAAGLLFVLLAVKTFACRRRI